MLEKNKPPGGLNKGFTVCVASNLNFKLNILEEVPSYVKYSLFRISQADVIERCVECAIKDVAYLNKYRGFCEYFSKERVPYSVSAVFPCCCHCRRFPACSLKAFVFFLFMERLATVNEASLPKHLKSLLFLASQECQIKGLYTWRDEDPRTWKIIEGVSS